MMDPHAFIEALMDSKLTISELRAGGATPMNDTSRQDTQQWRMDRCGSVGASEVADAVRRLKNGSPAASRSSLMARKICERLTGVPVDNYQSQAMLKGIEREPLARSAYELRTGLSVQEVGVIRHPTISWSHASPDGLVGVDGVLEIKCPEHAAHLQTLLTRDIDTDYVTQMQWQLACTERQWTTYASWHPDFPPSMQLYNETILRDNKMIIHLETEVRAFLAELEARLAQLKDYYEAPR